MPVHDWKRVEAGIFHNFHLAWISELTKALNAGLLSEDYYALAEQRINPFELDVLALKANSNGHVGPSSGESSSGGTGLLIAPPKTKPIAETDLDFYRRKQNHITIRHVSDDDLVAVIEILSPGNKSGREAMRDFIAKAIELFIKGIHLVVVDLHPPTRRDPQGIHGAIWDEFTEQPYAGPEGKPFTIASYEVSASVRAYVERLGGGDELPEMPLFLKFDGQIPLPLEKTYLSAWEAVPRRWRSVLEAPPANL